MRRRAFLEVVVGTGGSLGLAGLGAAAGLSFGEALERGPLEGRVAGPARERGHSVRDAHIDATSAEAAGAEERHSARVLVLGGGVSGLSAAWWLARSGFTDYRVLELEDEVGGNSRAGAFEGFGPFPWGAHYLPLPTAEATELRTFLEEEGLVTGPGPDGDPAFDAWSLGGPLAERLFLNGAWIPGLKPWEAVPPDDARQLSLFESLIARYSASRGRDGKPAFASPMARSSDDPEFAALHGLSASRLLADNGVVAPRVLWMAEYACRDDYGTDLATTSAWAFLHYFCSRTGREHGGELAWAEGNARLVRRLEARSEGRVLPRRVVRHIEETPGGCRVAVDRHDPSDPLSALVREHWTAERVVCALPKFVVRHLVPDAPPLARAAWDSVTYAPWIVANLALDGLPRAPGCGPAWDNVVYGSPSLGYVDAGHHGAADPHGPRVITWYRPFPGEEPAAVRARLLSTPWRSVCEEALADLEPALPGLRSRLRRIEMAFHAHAMARPLPGGSTARLLAGARAAFDRIHFAHSDESGVSLFEEAHFHGVRAAREALVGMASGARPASGAVSVPMPR